MKAAFTEEKRMKYRVWLRGPDELTIVDVKSESPPSKGGIPGEEANEGAIKFGEGCWFRRSDVVAVVAHDQLA
jgi:hypothetical protein